MEKLAQRVCVTNGEESPLNSPLENMAVERPDPLVERPAWWPAWAGREAGRVAEAPSLLAGLGWLGGWAPNSDTKTSIT